MRCTALMNMPESCQSLQLWGSSHKGHITDTVVVVSGVYWTEYRLWGWLFQFQCRSYRTHNNKQRATRHGQSSRLVDQSYPCRPRPQNNLRPIDKGPRSSTSRNILQPPSPPLPPTSTLFLKPSRTCTHASTHANPSSPSAPPRFFFFFPDEVFLT